MKNSFNRPEKITRRRGFSIILPKVGASFFATVRGDMCLSRRDAGGEFRIRTISCRNGSSLYGLAQLVIRWTESLIQMNPVGR